MDSKNITKSIVGITIAALLIAAVVVPVINSAELGQTYNVPTHGKEQPIYNKDFDWWVHYWVEYDCQSAFVDLVQKNGDYVFIVCDVTVPTYYEAVYSPDFDMSYDTYGTWVIQFNATDGVAIGNNYLLSTNAPNKEYSRQAAYNQRQEVQVIVSWFFHDTSSNPRAPNFAELNNYALNPGTDDVEIGDGYYETSYKHQYYPGNIEEYFFNVTSLGIVNVGGDPAIKTLLYIIPVLMLVGLVITVAMSLRIKRD